MEIIAVGAVLSGMAGLIVWYIIKSHKKSSHTNCKSCPGRTSCESCPAHSNEDEPPVYIEMPKL